MQLVFCADGHCEVIVVVTVIASCNVCVSRTLFLMPIFNVLIKDSRSSVLRQSGKTHYYSSRPPREYDGDCSMTSRRRRSLSTHYRIVQTRRRRPCVCDVRNEGISQQQTNDDVVVDDKQQLRLLLSVKLNVVLMRIIEICTLFQIFSSI